MIDTITKTKKLLLRRLLRDPDLGLILCQEFSSHDWKSYQVYRDPGGYTSAWKRCARCSKILDEALEPIEGRYEITGKDCFRLNGF